MEEEFRRLNVEVGSLGTIKKDGVVLEPKSGDPYDFVFIDGADIRVHILVADAFPEICGKVEKWGHIHHKNGNQKDNRAENLIALDRGEHGKLHARKDGATKAVAAYDKQGHKVGEWESLKDAERATGARQTHIGRCCRGERKTAGGLYWTYTESLEEMEMKFNEAKLARQQREEERQAQIQKRKQKKAEERQSKKQPVMIKKKRFLEYDENGTFIREWNSVKEIAEHYGVTGCCIRRNIDGTHKFVKQNGLKRQFKKEIYFTENN